MLESQLSVFFVLGKLLAPIAFDPTQCIMMMCLSVASFWFQIGSVLMFVRGLEFDELMFG